ncbi:hypothetical protein BGX28_006975 [Mortierella sp. GBA30]|nr:hypothetical protein BGX28_006975 [Mortierella sp. GBA30]
MVEQGNTCFCSNEQPPEQNKVEDARCDRPCAGYPLEMCGSNPAVDSLNSKDAGTEVETGTGANLDNGREADGANAYASVLLVGNTVFATSVDTPIVDNAVEDNQNSSIGSDSVQKAAGESEMSPSSSGTTDTVIVGTASVQGDAEVGNATGEQNKDLQQEGTPVNDEKRYSDDEGEEDEDYSEEEDSEDEDEDVDVDSGRSKKVAVENGTNSSYAGIPIASTVVGALCLLGLCAFFIYLTRKRRRERVRAAWVDSVFGSSHRHNGDDHETPYSNSHSYIKNFNKSKKRTADHKGTQQRPALDDLESVSDGQSETTVDHHRHVPTVGTRHSQLVEVGDPLYSRAVRASVMLPATAAGKARRASKSNDVLYSADQKAYEEFFDQDEFEVDAEIAQLPDDYSVSHQPPQPSSTLQRPLYAASSGNSPYSHYCHSRLQQEQQPPLEHHMAPRPEVSIYPMQQQHVTFSEEPHYRPRLQFAEYSTNPFRDTVSRQSYPMPMTPHRSYRHSLDSTTARLHSTVPSNFADTSRQRLATSDYRRPHSYTAVDNRSGAAHYSQAEEQTGANTVATRTTTVDNNYRIAPHVLDEENELESVTAESDRVDSVIALSTENSQKSKDSGSLRQKLKRLSYPYVRAIRQQQQLAATSTGTGPLSYIEGSGGRSGNCHYDNYDTDGGGGGGGNGYDHSTPGSIQSERRWSRVLLKGVGGSGHKKDRHHRHHRPYQRRVSGGSEEVIDGLRSDGRGTGGPLGEPWKHRQVHSGSLASFRGLDDPDHPRLRVMNPDDGLS